VLKLNKTKAQWKGNYKLMNIYIISQYLNLDSPGEDRFYSLGREYISRGHNVTVLTIDKTFNLELGNKKIGFVQKNGLNIVAFNVPYDEKMSRWKKMSAYVKFARLAGKQGRQLPAPSVIVASSPPLLAALPAIKLSKYYQAPLVMEIRELWPDAPIERGVINNKLLIKAAHLLEEWVYEKSGYIIAASQDISTALKNRWVERSKIRVIGSEEDHKKVVEGYESVFRQLNVKQ